jgi:dienelactone hydrolase
MRRLLHISLLLIATVSTSGADRPRAVDRLFVPAAQPATPVVKQQAADLPLKREGADEKTWALLRDFDVAPETFEYQLQLVAEEEMFRLYRLVYPSPLRTPWPENNVVPAEFYVPRGASEGKKVPAAVVLDILDGSAILPRMMARAAAQNGLAAIYLPMPYYNARRPANDEHRRALADDPRRAADGIRQTVMDVRRARAILAARPEVDATQIGVTGISMGGIMTALAAGVDGQFVRVVPILSGGDLATIIFHAHETRKLRAAMEAKGMDRDAAAEALAPVEPLNFAARIGRDRCLMINASEDEVIPKETTDKLRAAAGGPQVLWLRAGHYTSLTYFPLMQKTVIDFLRDGKRPAEERHEGT